MAQIQHLSGPRWVICVGPRCRMRGSRRLARLAFRVCVGPVIRAQCLGLCGRAPVIVRYPDGTWYGGIHPDQFGALLQSADAGPLAGHRIPRRPPPESPSRELASKPLPEVPSELH